MKNVYKVVEQKNRDYTNNLKILKPDYVIHKKNEWAEGIQKQIRKKLLEQLRLGQVSQLNPSLRLKKMTLL